MNIAVINIKDIIKYALKLGLIIFLVYIGIKIINTNNIARSEQLKKGIQNEVQRISNNSYLECLDTSLALFSYKKVNENRFQILTNQQILAMGTGIFDKTIFQNTDLIINEEELTIDDTEELENQIEEIPQDITTEAVETNNITAKFTTQYGNVKINNQSKYELTEEILKPDVEITNKKDILIYHTHTCESYTPSDGYEYEASGNFRTTDLDKSVARVGSELKSYLENKGFSVIHNTTYHDYPAYSGSYSRSLETIQNALIGEDTQIVIDLHRDAVGSSSTYAPTIKINDTHVAQLMFVIGTDGGGLEHSNWKQNLKIAVKIQEKAEEMYPGLFRPIIVRNSRYNQHVTTGASIIEVGATGNTMDQCILSMQCLSNILEEVCK